jgi:hypothetical protein
MFRINLANRTTISTVLFYAGWWACAGGARFGHFWIGPVLTPLLIALHVYLSPLPKGELAFCGFLALFGFCLDTILIQSNLFSIEPPQPYAPFWLICMWILTGMTFESMLIFRQRLWLNMLMGGLLGPLSYLWSESFHILSYQRPLWLSLLVHAAIWAILTPVLFPVRDAVLRISLRRG